MPNQCQRVRHGLPACERVRELERELAEARQMQLLLAEHLRAACQVLARLAERRAAGHLPTSDSAQAATARLGDPPPSRESAS